MRSPPSAVPFLNGPGYPLRAGAVSSCCALAWFNNRSLKPNSVRPRQGSSSDTVLSRYTIAEASCETAPAKTSLSACRATRTAALLSFPAPLIRAIKPKAELRKPALTGELAGKKTAPALGRAETAEVVSVVHPDR